MGDGDSAPTFAIQAQERAQRRRREGISWKFVAPDFSQVRRLGSYVHFGNFVYVPSARARCSACNSAMLPGQCPAVFGASQCTAVLGTGASGNVYFHLTLACGVVSNSGMHLLLYNSGMHLLLLYFMSAQFICAVFLGPCVCARVCVCVCLVSKQLQ